MDKPLEHCELHYFNTILRPVRGFKRCTVRCVYFQLSNEHVCTITRTIHNGPDNTGISTKSKNKRFSMKIGLKPTLRL